jgi:hypothetical protein
MSTSSRVSSDDGVVLAWATRGATLRRAAVGAKSC